MSRPGPRLIHWDVRRSVKEKVALWFANHGAWARPRQCAKDLRLDPQLVTQICQELVNDKTLRELPRTRRSETPRLEPMVVNVPVAAVQP